MASAPTPILTRTPLVQFATSGVGPPTALYVGPGEAVLLQAWNSVTGARLDLDIRLLRPDGIIVPMRFEHLPAADRSTRQFLRVLSEGYILSATLTVPTGVRRGQLWARLQHGRGDSTDNFTVGQMMMAGWVSLGAGLGWPPAQRDDTGHNGGAIRSIAGTDPAAGVEISEVVPTGAIWRLIAMHFVLVTDATAPARQVNIIIDDGAATLHQLASPSTQAASTTERYNVFHAGATPTVSASAHVALTPLPAILFPSYRIRTSTGSLAGGDNFGAPQLWVEDWVVV